MIFRCYGIGLSAAEPTAGRQWHPNSEVSRDGTTLLVGRRNSGEV